MIIFRIESMLYCYLPSIIMCAFPLIIYYISGSFVGGFMIGEVGTRDAFRYMGLIAVAGGIAYKVIYFIWLKRFDTVITAKT